MSCVHVGRQREKFDKGTLCDFMLATDLDFQFGHNCELILLLDKQLLIRAGNRVLYYVTCIRMCLGGKNCVFLERGIEVSPQDSFLRDELVSEVVLRYIYCGS